MERNETTHPVYPLPHYTRDGAAAYDLADDEEGDSHTKVYRLSSGHLYAEADSFDFETKTADEMRAKLKAYGARFIGWEK
jgi:hypothetical protein